MARNLIVAQSVRVTPDGGVIRNPALPKLSHRNKCGVYFELQGMHERVVEVWLVGASRVWQVDQGTVAPPTSLEAVGLEIDLQEVPAGLYHVEVCDGPEVVARELEI